jgi:hypothetical protein
LFVGEHRETLRRLARCMNVNWLDR